MDFTFSQVPGEAGMHRQLQGLDYRGAFCEPLLPI